MENCASVDVDEGGAACGVNGEEELVVGGDSDAGDVGGELEREGDGPRFG